MPETPRVQPYDDGDSPSSVLRCVPYDARAPLVAEVVSEMIVERLGPVAVEHIGSTAVPGCAGKGIVDLMIVVEPPTRKQVVARLLSLGFQTQTGGLQHPEERPMLEGAIRFEGDHFRIHVHVVPRESDEPDIVRRFRDRLRARPDLREEYIALKRSIIESGVTDREQYTRLKTRFIKKVLQNQPSEPTLTERQAR